MDNYKVTHGVFNVAVGDGGGEFVIDIAAREVESVWGLVVQTSELANSQQSTIVLHLRGELIRRFVDGVPVLRVGEGFDGHLVDFLFSPEVFAATFGVVKRRVVLRGTVTGTGLTGRRLLDTALEDLAREVHERAVRKGWRSPPPTFGEFIALVHTELSEALEEYRAGADFREVRRGEDGEVKGIPIELADVVIRVVEQCAALGIDLAEAIRRKNVWNEFRPWRHGKIL